MDSNSSYFLNRLNEAILKSNLQPTINELQIKFDQIYRSVKSVENNHEIIRANIYETKLNLKKREEMYWKRSVDQNVHNGHVSIPDSGDDLDIPSPDIVQAPDTPHSLLLESKLSGLQIDLSVLSSPEEQRPPAFSDGEASCGSPEVVCLNSPLLPPAVTPLEGGTNKPEGVTSSGCDLPIRLNDRVLVMRKDKNWYEGIITNINSVFYTIYGDGFIEKTSVKTKLCPLRDLTTSHLRVGSRVVALYGQLDIYYGGVAAETACLQNGERVLVFFDDGFAQYLTPNNVYLVAKSSSEVWEEVGKLCRDFIKDYLSLYPKRPMLRLRAGDEIVAEWRGKWCKPRVTDVDCSLARVHFVEENMKEWIYRGSTRFKLLFNFSTTHTEQQLITSNKHIITQMLYDSLCPPCLVAAETNTGIMESPPKLSNPESGSGGLVREEEIEPSSSTLQTDSMTDRMIEEFEDERYEDSTEDNYISPDASDDESEPSYHPFTRSSAKSVPYPGQDPSLSDPQDPSEQAGRKTRSKWRNVNIPNIISSPRVGWEPGTVASSNTFQPDQLVLQKAVLYNNHSYYTSNEYSECLDRLAVHNSLSFWTEESDKLELRQTVKEERGDGDLDSQGFSETCFLTEHSYSRLSSVHRPKPPKKFPKKIVLGDPSIKVSRKSAFEDELISNVQFSPHMCTASCAINTSLPPSLHPINSLSIPILLGWKRELSFVPHKSKPAHAYYIAPSPCRRRMRSLDEIEYYLHITQTKNVSIDMFTLDTSIELENKIYHLDNPKIFFGDLTMGSERIPIPCVNEIDTRPLPPLQYTTKRICYEGVNINTDSDFMICCDCTDDCQDKVKCACCQLTAEVSRTKDFYGYQNRRLTSNCGVAIYECNSRCKCSRNCSNRVIQNGIQVLLQVFKTDNKGWGIKCLNDIPKGSFICTYAGHIYNDELANELGVNLGDDYLAELDYLDVMETKKQGYEPYYGAILFSENSTEGEGDQIKSCGIHQEIGDNIVILPEIEGDYPIVSMCGKPSGIMDIGRDVILLDSHSDTESSGSDNQPVGENLMQENQTLMINMVDPDSEALIESTKLGMIEDRFPKDWCTISLKMTNGDVSLAAELLERADKLAIASGPNATDDPEQLLLEASKPEPGVTESVSEQASEVDFPFIAQVCGSYSEAGGKQPIIASPDDILVISDEDEFADFPASPELNPETSNHFHSDSIYLTPDSIPTNQCLQSEFHTYKNIRSLYEEKGAYVMDAKFVGNIGRYFNHSCQPNIFTHTVFLDTHDLRFPWVAFFAKKRIKANTELTWDYNYEIGSVPNKVLRCLCGTTKCRGRLL